MRFAFDVMASGKPFANRKDVTGLVSLLHSERARVKDTTNTLMGIMDPHNRDRIAFETFRYKILCCFAMPSGQEATSAAAAAAAADLSYMRRIAVLLLFLAIARSTTP